ncbi:phosphomannomutase [Aurantimonas sp. MSK8Z-1]|uniref:phosphomannomutase n=1 Tax=Mangrovibrevibacter kandeliae TaxID=2968473 RepID=UPI0021197F1A|nr:phosphomannomutase [Aurantimonas sp. MSK8Z-1]MCW4116982.1 phosphomannomutase [Aurantimonas sp. MSK8Z-1]
MESVRFGTSGLRGLVSDLLGWASLGHTLAFLASGVAARGAGADRLLLIGEDLRASSPALARDCARAARLAGWTPVACGPVATPALALQAMQRRSPAIMVTGSHIPDDRNGLKFYTAEGEIDKADEMAIMTAFAGLPGPISNDDDVPAAAETGVMARFAARYRDWLGPDALTGLRVGVYQHSSVARDLLVDLLADLGAQVEPLGRSASFVPVDTEAHRREDLTRLAEWAATGRFDAIVSTDGDADRPLVCDETGRPVRGDVLGLLVADVLGLRTLVTPVTSSSSVEAAGPGRTVLRTRVGSPFVIEAMQAAQARGHEAVGGFEANGGFLLASDIERDGRILAALPTRDSVLPILCALLEIGRRGGRLSDIVQAIGAGNAAADRLQGVPAERSGPFLARLESDVGYRSRHFAPVGAVAGWDAIDGVRVHLADGSVVHYRASGNAPELRCYVEAGSSETAETLLKWGLTRAADALEPQT